MSYIVTIRKNDTGEIRRYECDLIWDDEGCPFWWSTDGNAGCDCNLGRNFLRAGPDAPPADNPSWNYSDFDCGETAYRPLDAYLPDGRVIPLDTDRGPR